MQSAVGLWGISIAGASPINLITANCARPVVPHSHTVPHECSKALVLRPYRYCGRCSSGGRVREFEPEALDSRGEKHPVDGLSTVSEIHAGAAQSRHARSAG